MKTIATHNTKFHADDVYAVAVIKILSKVRREPEEPKVIRTREKGKIDQADIVVDVGKVFDPDRLRFDHHQGGIEPRENGVPYASFGLVWRHFGEEITCSREVVEKVDRVLVQPVDAGDEGVDIVDLKIENLKPHTVSDFIGYFNPTWKESELESDEQFSKACDIATDHLNRVITHAKDSEEAKKYVEKSYQEAKDKRVITLQERWPWKEVVSSYTDPLFVIYPVKDEVETRFHLQTVPYKVGGFKNRKDFPDSWVGAESGYFQEELGLNDVIFSHKSGFLIVTSSEETAMALAKKAV